MRSWLMVGRRFRRLLRSIGSAGFLRWNFFGEGGSVEWGGTC